MNNEQDKKLIVFGLSGIIYDATQQNRRIKIPSMCVDRLEKEHTWISDTNSIKALIESLKPRVNTDQLDKFNIVESDSGEITTINYEPFKLKYRIFNLDNIMIMDEDLRKPLYTLILDIYENGISKKDNITVKFHYSYVFELLYYKNIENLVRLTSENYDYIRHNDKILQLCKKYNIMDIYNKVLSEAKDLIDNPPVEE